MSTTLERDLKKKRSNFLKLELNKYLDDKNEIAQFEKPLWFKGSRYR